MAAPKGNKFWQIRAKHGRDFLISDPEKLAEDCEGYFEWVAANPLMATEARVVSLGGSDGSEVRMVDVPRMRAATLKGLCLYLGIDVTTWMEMRKREGFSNLCSRVDDAIYEQKFSGASAGLLNHAIIARDLGLADKRELTGKDGEPIKTESDTTTKIVIDPAAIAKAIRELDDET